MGTQTAGQASWTARALFSEGNPDNGDDHAEITGRWDTWFDDHQREAEEVGARAAIDWQRAEDASPAAEDFDRAAEILWLHDACTAIRDVLLRGDDHLAARRGALQIIDSIGLGS